LTLSRAVLRGALEETVVELLVLPADDVGGVRFSGWAE
jgi:hypothetical protein